MELDKAKLGISIQIGSIEQLEKLDAVLDRYNNMIGVNAQGDPEVDEWDEFAYELSKDVAETLDTFKKLSEAVED